MRFLTVLLLALLLSPPALLHAEDSKPAKKPKKGREKPDANAMAYASQYHWADWVEPDFPFFSSVLDCRDLGEGFPKDNLTARGLILNLGHNIWACFDTDLLRIAAIWQGKEGEPPVTPAALAPGSYHVAGQKTKDGEDDLPHITGTVLQANGLYPGWEIVNSATDKPSFADPRSLAPDKEELGRGPLPATIGEFLRANVVKYKPVYGFAPSGIPVVGQVPMFPPGRPLSYSLEYRIGTTAISEILNTESQADDWTPAARHITIAPHPDHLWLAIGQGEKVKDLFITHQSGGSFEFDSKQGPAYDPKTYNPVLLPGDIVALHLPPVKIATRLEISIGVNKSMGLIGRIHVIIHDAPQKPDGDLLAPHLRWPQVVTTRAKLDEKKDAYVVDDIPLPLENPWKRNVRLADISFLPDGSGRAAAVTMDGDVWLLSGLKDDLQKVKWCRFTSGLHEPMSIVVRKAASDAKPKTAEARNGSYEFEMSGWDIFVFDRNGIWRLRDNFGHGEADTHEMFCNRFSQTAETREFPNSMKLAPDGSFIISKGGQEGSHLGKDNGTVIRVSPDGKKYEVIGWGLRQPFAGVNPKTGLVTASDQEGNYVPTTPIQIIRDHQFYGHLATIQPHEQYPQTIADPLTWIPHPVCASAATQVWLYDAKEGSINDEMILVSYNKPELFRVLMNNREKKPQAAVTSWIRNLDFPTLNAKVNPADGQLYAIGFQIWGTTVKRISGLGRIRYTGERRVLLLEAAPMDKGVLLHFNEPLDPKFATDVANYSVERWNYKRTYNYGSPHLKRDGSPGQEWMPVSSAYLSKDGKTVFIGIPEMLTTVMQMRVGYGLKGADGLPARNNAYFTPYMLSKFDPEKEGFEKIVVDLTPRKVVAAAAVTPTADEGKRLYEMMGCMACHSIDGTLYGKVGPSWKGLYGSVRDLAKGGDKVIANDDYIRESILDPSAKIVKGFEKLDTGMPIYNGVLNESQIQSIILFIKTLK